MSAQAVSLFIGMVTHARSRFDANGAARGLVDSLAKEAGRLGMNVVAAVSDRDDYDPKRYPLTRWELIRSAVYQARLEHRWRRYVADAAAAGAVDRGLDLVLWGGMTVKRTADSLAPRPWGPTEGLAGTKSAVRLINIDLSHLRLMDEAAASGCEWVLILEDDAGTADAESAVRDVASVMAALADTHTGFVTMSESIGHDALGVGGILTPAPDLDNGAMFGRELWRASRPVTNTVCANLYRPWLLAMVRAEIGRQGLLPVAPIDWRLNAALMVLYEKGVVDSETCLWARPGVFTQRSMHDSVTRP